MRWIAFAAATLFIGVQASMAWPTSPPSTNPVMAPILARAATCKSVSSCKEAVELWCSGYRRADGDGDGVPCENVCHSRERVKEIQRSIGCE